MTVRRKFVLPEKPITASSFNSVLLSTDIIFRYDLNENSHLVDVSFLVCYEN